MNTKKTSSYKKDNKGKDDSTAMSHGKGLSKDANSSRLKPKEKRTPTEEERKEFNPYLNMMAHKYEITCFACEKKKWVAVEPLDGVPVICDECVVELEARRLMDVGGFQKTKKLKCKNCEADFYALNESYLLCDNCYDSFSHRIKALRRGLVPYNCKTCDKLGFIHPKTYEEKKKEGDHPICRDCMNKEAKDKELAKKKARIGKVKDRNNASLNNPEEE